MSTKNSCFVVFCGMIVLVMTQPVAAQFYPGLPNASGNQPILGNAQRTNGLTGIPGNPNANRSGISAYGVSPPRWVGNDAARRQLGYSNNQNQAFRQNGWQAYQGNPSRNTGINLPPANMNTASAMNRGFANTNNVANRSPLPQAQRIRTDVSAFSRSQFRPTPGGR